MKPPPPIPKAPSTSARPQVTASPVTNAMTKVTIPARSPELKINIQKHQKKPQPKRQTNQQAIEKSEKPDRPPVDYQVLLLTLADEYLSAAHRHGTKMALATSEADVEEYHKLISTGLGCLEAVLKVYSASISVKCVDIMTNSIIRTGVYNHAKKPWSAYAMRVHCLRRRRMTLRRRRL